MESRRLDELGVRHMPIGSDEAHLLPSGATTLSLEGFDQADGDDLLWDWHQPRRSRWRTWKRRCLPRGGWDECILTVTDWLQEPLHKKLIIILSTVLLLVVLTIAIAVSLRPKHPQDLCHWDSLYLPNHVRPTGYNISLRAPLDEKYEVDGEVLISLNVQKESRCVVLHSIGHTFSSVALQVGDKKIAGKVYRHNDILDQLILKFDRSLTPGARVVLHLAFSYLLLPGLDGFYRSSYVDDLGVNHTIASTQFESIGARKAFPCWDEPAYKVPFKVTLITPPAPIVTLSNMPLEREEVVKGGLVAHHFSTSPPMSTYLVAWVVGRMAQVNMTCPTMKGDLPIRVWSTPEKVGQLGTSLRVACVSVQTFEQDLQVAYTLPKMDLVGIPNFSAGAMENWGLITYRETDLLVDPDQQDIRQEFEISLVVSHEISHQWFGDLVTLTDWNELWLNEGFATYFENVAASAYKPEFSYFDFFYSDNTHRALGLDSLSSSHPLTVSQKIRALSEIDNMFDDIMYQKGGAVLRMLRWWMNRNNAGSSGGMRRKVLEGSSDPFLSGLSHYLHANSYGSSTYQVLWGNLTEATGMPVNEWMRTWTLRRGFPLIVIEEDRWEVVVRQVPFPTVQIQSDAEEEESQQTSGSDDGASSPSPSPTTCNSTVDLGSWWVPLSYKTQSSPDQLQWVDFTGCELRLQGKVEPDKQDWVLVNVGRTGYYRVNYSQPLWDRLLVAAKDPAVIQEADMAGLLDDSYALSMARQLNVKVFLQLLQVLSGRAAPEYTPWVMALAAVGNMAKIFDTAALNDKKWADCAQLLSNYVVTHVTGPALANIQIPGEVNRGVTFTVNASESSGVRLLRPALLDAAGAYGDEALQHQAVGILEAALKPGGTPPHADVLFSVYKMSIRSGDPEVFDKLQQRYREVKDVNDKSKLLKALTVPPSAPLIERALQYALSPDVPLQDVAKLVGYIGERGGEAFHLTWKFLFEHIDQLLHRYPGADATYSLGRPLNKLAKLFVDDTNMKQLKAFAKKYHEIVGPSFLKMVHESMKKNQMWLQDHGQDVCQWLRDQKEGGRR